VDYPQGYFQADTTFNYDPAGNRSTVVDGGGSTVYTTNNLNQYTAVAAVNYDYDDNGNLTDDGANTYSYDAENRLLTVTKTPEPLAAACDNTGLVLTTGGSANWFSQTSQSYYGGDAAQSGAIGHSQETWLQTSVSGAGTLVFWWKVSSQGNKDFLEFWLDGVRQVRISGTVNWQQKSYPITGAGSHTLKWRYVKDGSKVSGSDCGWVDYVQWSGSYPNPLWSTVSYTYDAAGRRVQKAVDGQTTTKYVYDGDHCIAEYDGSGSLLRKYIYGPRVDEPICMIETAGSATYYYHFDGLGSVVALTNSSGSAVQLYEYSVYGQVAASDPNHPNRFLFTGREFDKDTGLYYYRARYYNPEIGRFLQTDPIGCAAGINWYAHCGNNPLMFIDPFGLCRTSNYCEMNYSQMGLLDWAGAYVGAAGHGAIDAIDRWNSALTFGKSDEWGWAYSTPLEYDQHYAGRTATVTEAFTGVSALSTQAALALAALGADVVLWGSAATAAASNPQAVQSGGISVYQSLGANGHCAARRRAIEELGNPN
jgi:RHS repeat-associated protein